MPPHFAGFIAHAAVDPRITALKFREGGPHGRGRQRQLRSALAIRAEGRGYVNRDRHVLGVRTLMGQLAVNITAQASIGKWVLARIVQLFHGGPSISPCGKLNCADATGLTSQETW